MIDHFPAPAVVYLLQRLLTARSRAHHIISPRKEKERGKNGAPFVADLIGPGLFVLERLERKCGLGTTAGRTPETLRRDHCLHRIFITPRGVALSSGLAMLEIVRIPAEPSLRRPHVHIYTAVLRSSPPPPARAAHERDYVRVCEPGNGTV